MSHLLIAAALLPQPVSLEHDLPRPSAAALAIAGVSADWWRTYDRAGAEALLEAEHRLEAAGGDARSRLQGLREVLEDLPPGEVRDRVLRSSAWAAEETGEHLAAARFYAEAATLSRGGARREAHLRQAEQALLADEPAFALEGLRALDRVEPTVPFNDSVSTSQFARRVLLYVRAGDPERAVERYVQSAPNPANAAAVKRYGDFASAVAEELPPRLRLPFWRQAVRRMGGNVSAYSLERLRRVAAMDGDPGLSERLAEIGIRFRPDSSHAATQLQVLRNAAVARGRDDRARTLDRLILGHPHTDVSDRWDAAIRLGVEPPVGGTGVAAPLVPQPDPAFAAPPGTSADG